MSGYHEIVCPNCGFSAKGNFCAQCGQSTHLHNDTFLSLTTHFVSHYFHFENKFWKTIKTLVAQPGRLDIAFYQKQRARYVQPISLYIFVSVFFFIVFGLTFKFEQRTIVTDGRHFQMTYEWSMGLKHKFHAHSLNEEWVADYNCDSLRKIKQDLFEINSERNNYFSDPLNRFQCSWPYFQSVFYNYFIFPYAYRHQMYDFDKPVSFVYNKFFALIPKVFFVLMPFLAMLLYGFFFKKKAYNFVNYAVLSLHTHVFMFLSIAFLLLVLGSFLDASNQYISLLFIVIIP